MKGYIGVAAILALLAGCGGGGQEKEVPESTAQPEKTATQTPQASPPAGEQGSPGKGIGPITDVTLGPISHEVAERGEKIFESKCAACHKFNERYVGPSLAGVTVRREPEWILNIILNPQGMLKEDPVAKQLLAEYLTPMTYQNITEEDAKALLEYFRAVDSGREEAGEDKEGEEE
jgi:mono/diheme cytochrome c family protein